MQAPGILEQSHTICRREFCVFWKQLLMCCWPRKRWARDDASGPAQGELDSATSLRCKVGGFRNKPSWVGAYTCARQRASRPQVTWQPLADTVARWGKPPVNQWRRECPTLAGGGPFYLWGRHKRMASPLQPRSGCPLLSERKEKSPSGQSFGSTGASTFCGKSSSPRVGRHLNHERHGQGTEDGERCEEQGPGGLRLRHGVHLRVDGSGKISVKLVNAPRERSARGSTQQPRREGWCGCFGQRQPTPWVVFASAVCVEGPRPPFALHGSSLCPLFPSAIDPKGT